METQNYGKLKIGIDWENKGWVSFNQDTYNTANVLPNTRFFDTQLGSNAGGDATKKQSIVPLGLYGLEEVEVDFHESSGTYTLGVGSPLVSGDFTIETSPLTVYGFWVWLSSDNGYTNDGSHIFQIFFDECNVSNDIVATTVLPIDLPNDGLVHAYYQGILTDSTTAHTLLTFFKSDLDASPLKLTVHGIMMRTDLVTTEPTWGAGEDVPDTIIDNDITPYVLQAVGSIGKTAWETILFDEGQLNLTLNNADRRFSPEYIDGAYYTYLQPYRRIWVSASDEFGVYKLIWSGWTHQFSLQTGNKGARTATLTARQGKYNIEAQDSDSLVAVADKPSILLILDLFSGGYVVPSQSGDETITRDIIVEHFDVDGVTVPIFGVDFVENQKDKKYLGALENLAELNGNYIFLSRQGKVIFKTYESVKDTTPDELPYNLTRSMNYVYSPTDLYKQIVVNYDHYAYADDIEMQGQDVTLSSGATDFPFSVFPEYNGKPLIGEVVLDVSSFLPTDYNATPASGTANAAFTEINEGLYTWYTGLANDTTDLDYRLSIISRDSGNVWYAQDVNQSYNVAGVSDIALDTLTYSNPLITNEAMAIDFANMQIDRRASILAWFDKAEIVNKSAEAINWILNHSLGDVVYSQEEQSGDIPKSLIIIGEQFTYTPTYFQMTYNLAPTGAEVDVAGFTFAVNGQEVDFNNESVVSDTPTWAWDFGDP